MTADPRLDVVDRWLQDEDHTTTVVSVRRLLAELDTVAPLRQEPVHEWQCTACGATTRARMADRERP
jgi:hypothetical protein